MPDLPHYLTRPSNAATMAERKRLAIATVMPPVPSKPAPGPPVRSYQPSMKQATSSNTVPLGPKRKRTNSTSDAADPVVGGRLGLAPQPARGAPFASSSQPTAPSTKQAKALSPPATKQTKAQVPPTKKGKVTFSAEELEKRRKQSEESKRASQTPEALEKRRKQQEKDVLRNEARRKVNEARSAGVTPEELEKRRKQSERDKRRNREAGRRGQRETDMVKVIRAATPQPAGLPAPQHPDFQHPPQMALPQPHVEAPPVSQPLHPPATLGRDWNAPSVLRTPKPVIEITAPRALQECYAEDPTRASSDNLEHTLAAFDLPAPRVVTRAEAEFRVSCSLPNAGAPDGPPLNWVFGARVPHTKHYDELLAAWETLRMAESEGNAQSPLRAHYYGFCKCATDQCTFFPEGYAAAHESLSAAWHKCALLSIKNILVGQDPCASARAGRIQQWHRRADNDLRGHPRRSRFLLNAGLGTGVEFADHLGIPDTLGSEGLPLEAHRGLTDMTLHLPCVGHDAATYTVLAVFGGAESFGVLVFPQLNLEIELYGGTRVYFQASRLAYYIQPPDVQPRRGLYVTAFSCAAATAHWMDLEAAEAKADSARATEAAEVDVSEAHNEPAPRTMATSELETGAVMVPTPNEAVEPEAAVPCSEADEAEDVDQALETSRDGYTAIEERVLLADGGTRLCEDLPGAEEGEIREVSSSAHREEGEIDLLNGALHESRGIAMPLEDPAPADEDRGRDESRGDEAGVPLPSPFQVEEPKGRCDSDDDGGIDMDVADMAAWLLGPD